MKTGNFDNVTQLLAVAKGYTLQANITYGGKDSVMKVSRQFLLDFEHMRKLRGKKTNGTYALLPEAKACLIQFKNL